MLRMITGLPGHNKTSNTLHLFLEVKDRPKYATFINGFDYEKHGVTQLENLEGIFDLPPNSLIFCDEAQKFMRARSKTDKIPDWITKFETHRHLGIDLWYTTQHPMLIDVHVRRLTEEHWHYFRPLGMQKATSVRKWTGVKENPLDYHAAQEADIQRATPPAYIFNEYTSTVQDTNKARFPKKFIVAGAVLALIAGFVIYKGYGLISKHTGDNEQTTQAAFNEGANAANTAPPPSFIQTSQARPLDKKTRSPEDYIPRNPYDPSTAPIYDHLTEPTDFPRVAACMDTKESCKCYSQQATRIYIPSHVCKQMVKDGWFDNWLSSRNPPQQASEPTTGQQTGSRVQPQAQTTVIPDSTDPFLNKKG